VGKTVSEVSFPAGALSFVRARNGVAADLADAKVETAVRPDPKKAGSSILTVTVTGGGTAIPSGIVASLSFTVAKDASVGQTIALAHTPRAFSTGSEARPVEPVTGRDGEITVEGTAPIIACFYYMH
jgi:hypothetical protein